MSDTTTSRKVRLIAEVTGDYDLPPVTFIASSSAGDWHLQTYLEPGEARELGLKLLERADAADGKRSLIEALALDVKAGDLLHLHLDDEPYDLEALLDALKAKLPDGVKAIVTFGDERIDIERSDAPSPNAAALDFPCPAPFHGEPDGCIDKPKGEGGDPDPSLGTSRQGGSSQSVRIDQVVSSAEDEAFRELEARAAVGVPALTRAGQLRHASGGSA